MSYRILPTFDVRSPASNVSNAFVSLIVPGVGGAYHFQGVPQTSFQSLCKFILRLFSYAEESECTVLRGCTVPHDMCTAYRYLFCGNI